jgi:small ligand-binding sensory domain FIST
MQWATVAATEERFDQAMGTAIASLERELGGASPDLVLAFVSPNHRAVWDAVPRLLGDAFPGAVRVGCSAGGVIGGGHEVENAGAISLAGAVLPGARVEGFRLDPGSEPDDTTDATRWAGRLPVSPGTTPTIVLLPDPFTCEAERLVDVIDRGLEGATVVGGLASGARQAGTNMVFSDRGAWGNGAVGLAIEGGHRLDTIVAQGCRPVGNPMFITGCERHLVTELDGRPPLEILHELFSELDERDQELLRYSLFLGVVMRPEGVRHGHGDFLIRNLAGIDATTGALRVAATVAPGQVVQFHLRDRVTSAQDLQDHLEAFRDRSPGGLGGGLMFSCLGRGTNLYGEPDHDSRLIREVLGELPVGGFFCNGEIGPVQGRTFVHGYTSALAVFSPSDD